MTVPTYATIPIRLCRTGRTRWLAWICLLLFALSSGRNSDAQTGEIAGIAEWQVKAAYLYKFGSYIEWPARTFPGPESPLTIGVYDDADALADALIKIAANHTINGRSVSVRKLRADDSLAGINVLFIGGSNKARYADIFSAAKGLPILTVTESEDAITRGSMINFVLIDGRVRFEAAPKAAKQNNLTISARLLAAAYRVVPEAT